jgi:hypothetical protein
MADAKKKTRAFRYPFARLDRRGASLTIRRDPKKPRQLDSARTAAHAYAGRRGFTVSCWRTRAGNLVVERTNR